MLPKVWIVAVTFSIPFSIINFNAYLKGNSPSAVQVICSSIFVLLWLISGFIAGYKERKDFLIAATAYWLVVILLLFLGYYAEIDIIFIPSALIFAGPLYGLKYFIGNQPDMMLTVYSIGIIYIGIVSGYGVGILYRLFRR
ncbi:hypothetical protein AB6A23_23880 [Paenibacillus tarimensis]